MPFYILVVSRDIEHHEVINATLRELGMDLILKNVGTDVREAKEKVQDAQHCFDLIVVDSTVSEEQRIKIQQQESINNWRVGKNGGKKPPRVLRLDRMTQDQIKPLLLENIFALSPALSPGQSLVSTPTFTSSSAVASRTLLSSPLSTPSSTIGRAASAPPSPLKVGVSADASALPVVVLPSQEKEKTFSVCRELGERQIHARQGPILNYLNTLRVDAGKPPAPSMQTLFPPPPWEERKKEEEKKRQAAEKNNNDEGCCSYLAGLVSKCFS